MRWIASVVLLVALVMPIAAVVAPGPDAARAADGGDGAYIVMMNGFDPAAVGIAADVQSLAESVGATPSFVYSTLLKGFAADLTAAQVRGLLGL